MTANANTAEVRLTRLANWWRADKSFALVSAMAAWENHSRSASSDSAGPMGV
jgi:hypothetical protein